MSDPGGRREVPGRSVVGGSDALLGEAREEAGAAWAGGVALLEVVERGLGERDVLLDEGVAVEGAGDLGAEDIGFGRDARTLTH